MWILRNLRLKVLASLLVALSMAFAIISLPATASAAPAGSNFDHIIIVAMENQNYCSGVIVCGLSSTSFIPQLAAAGVTMSNYQAYSQGIGGCSHGCYEAFTAGNQLLSDGGCPRASSPCSGAPQPDITKQLQTAGLTAALFCEDGCPRGSDHFPWVEYADDWQSCMAASGGMNCAGTAGPDGALAFNTVSSSGNTAFINYLNSASPANYIWFTPTDSHNMHDNSVTSGDAYVQNLLVGTGTLASPSSNSVFGSSLWKAGHTLFYLWWDENSNPPMVLYGPMVKVGYTATETLNEYYMLHLIENNWGMSAITSVVSGDAAPTDLLASLGPVPLSASFVAAPNPAIAGTMVSFTATALGGTPPYSYSWAFGDGSTGSGVTTTHTYATSGSYTVNLTVTDSASPAGSAKSTQTIQVNPVPALTASFTFSPTRPTSSQSVSFSATGTGGVPPYTYSWNFGDGATGSGQTPSHTYANAGTFTATLNITDAATVHATSSQPITISPPGTLTASFTYSPAVPISGETVTFTASVNGGTSPYSYTWNLGGTSKTGNPASQSFNNGTYSIHLNVTDAAGKSTASTQTLVVQPSSGSSTVPLLIGWGGIRLDEAAVGGGVNQPTNPPASQVFPGEKATNMELILIEMKAMGYNTVRVDFDPYCTSSQYMSTYSATNLQRAIQIAQYYGFWIIVDYHGYSEPFSSSQATCWLNFWSGVTNQFKNSYSQIIWEPLNEPCYDSSTCAGSSTTNNMCSGASACIPVLSHEYQLWINQTRAQGDTHWIVVQNICSYGCSLSNWASGFPTVTDPLGTLTQGGRIFISLHSYMGYSSSNWNNATADSMAQQYYQAVVTGVAATGWPALNTEGGADPLCTSCAPDQILTGSAGYTTVTFHFIQTLTNLYDRNTPQRINWIWWPAGSWTNTPGAGVYGALQCASVPIGWGCLLKFLSLGPPPPDFVITASSPSAVLVSQSLTSTITIAPENGFTNTVNLADSFPSGLVCNPISQTSITGSGTATVSCSASVAGNYLLLIIGSSGGLVHVATATFSFQDFQIIATSPVSVPIGSSSISTITLTALNSFAGTISLSDTLPTGLTCGSITPNSVTGSGTATLSCSSTNKAVYSVTFTAASNSLTHTATASFSFGNPPDFIISASSPTQVSVGTSATSTITISLIQGLTGTISLSDTVPYGLSCGSFSRTSISGNGTATISCSSNNPASYLLTITGAGSGLSHTATATFTFLAVHGLMMLNVPAAESVNELTLVSFSVSGTDSSLPAPLLTIIASQLPNNATFSASQGTSASGTFTWTPSETQTGIYTITFSLSDGVTSIIQSVVVTVLEPDTPPSITTPGPETAIVGKSLSFTIVAVNPSVANDPVTLQANGLAPNMAFDTASGAFSFTPDQSQAGKTFVVNFTATYSDNPSTSSTKSVTIKTESSASSPGGGPCLTCIFPTGLTTTVWLVIIGALIGVVSSISLLNIRARADLAARKKSRSTGSRASDQASNYVARKTGTSGHRKRPPMEDQSGQ